MQNGRRLLAWALCGIAWSYACNAANPPAGNAGVGGGIISTIAGAGSAGNALGGVAGGASGMGATTSSTGGTVSVGSAGSMVVNGKPTFNRVWIEVLEAKGCSSGYCHGGNAGTLLMDNPSHAYTNLVNQPATGPKCGMMSKLRVKPGDIDMSLIVDKISHATPSCGEPMPIGVRFDPDCLVPGNPGVCTKQSEIQLVKDWIAAGANNDS